MTVREAGRKGGKARSERLSKHRKQEIARLGYLASPISKLAARLDNQPGKIHDFPWPTDIIQREIYVTLDDQSKKKMATKLVRTAMSRLGLRPPIVCSNCTLPGYSRVSAHHDDYSQPMRVRFICHACHISLHRLSGKQQFSGQSPETPENK